jgi:hypothetical protein
LRASTKSGSNYVGAGVECNISAFPAKGSANHANVAAIDLGVSVNIAGDQSNGGSASHSWVERH